jgi:hypothetical protein
LEVQLRHEISELLALAERANQENSGRVRLVVWRSNMRGTAGIGADQLWLVLRHALRDVATLSNGDVH